MANALKLYTLPPAFGLRNVSPFCLKIEMLMTQLGLDFEHFEEGDPRKAPKGKLPFLVSGTETIADSELIAVYLDELSEGRVFGSYTPAQRAEGLALSRLVEEHLYWILVASRWLDDSWWPNVVDAFFSGLPALLRPVITRVARKQLRDTYRLHGLGRHTLDEQRDFARRDLRALVDAVASGSTLDGAAPGFFDFAVAGFLAGLYDQQPPTWINAVADDYPSLREYAEQVQSSVGVWGRPV